MIERGMVWRENKKSSCWSYFSAFPEHYKFSEMGLSKGFSTLVLWAYNSYYMNLDGTSLHVWAIYAL